MVIKYWVSCSKELLIHIIASRLRIKIGLAHVPGDIKTGYYEAISQCAKMLQLLWTRNMEDNGGSRVFYIK